jgi:hypothetical protein
MTDPTTLAAFDFACDWSRPVRLSCRSLTDIDASDTGRETRTGRRLSLPVAIEFTAGAWADDSRAAHIIEAWIAAHLGEPIAAPLWSEAVRVTGTASGTTIPVASGALTNRLFHADRGVMLWRDSALGPVSQVLNVASLGASSITTVETIDAGFGAGSLVAPVIVTDPLISFEALGWTTSNRVSGRVRFDEAAAEAVGYGLTPRWPVWRGLPIWPVTPDWSSQPESEQERTAKDTRSDTGIVAVTLTGAQSRRRLSASTVLTSRAQIGDALSIFAWARGRLRKMWVPTAKRDFELTADPSGGSMLVVQWTGYTANEWPHPGRRAVLVHDAATWHARKVTNAVDNGNGTESLTLESALPSGLSAAAAVDLLVLARLDSDDLALDFDDTDFASLRGGFIELADEAAAALTGTSPANGVIDEEGVLIA